MLAEFKHQRDAKVGDEVIYKRNFDTAFRRAFEVQFSKKKDSF